MQCFVSDKYWGAALIGVCQYWQISSTEKICPMVEYQSLRALKLVIKIGITEFCGIPEEITDYSIKNTSL